MVMSYDRSFVGPVDLADENTMEGRVVPWSAPTAVCDPVDDGRLDRYVEMFERGAFDPQVSSPNRGTTTKVELRDQHDGGIGKIGYALTLVDRDDGLWARFRLLSTTAGDVRQMIADGVDGLSMRFHSLRSTADRRGDGRTVTRHRAYLEHVALVSVPAYAAARVLAVRDDPDVARLEAEAEAERATERDRYRAMLDDIHQRGLKWRRDVGHTVN